MKGELNGPSCTIKIFLFPPSFPVFCILSAWHFKNQNCNAFSLSESHFQSQEMLQDINLKKMSTCLWHIASIYYMFLQCLCYIFQVTYLKGFKSEQHIIGSLQINVVHHQLPWSQLHKDG